MVEGFLAGVGSERPINDLSGGDRYMVNIHTEKVNCCAAAREGALGYIETLKEDGTGAESEIEDRGHVPAGTFLRLWLVIVRRVWELRLRLRFHGGVGRKWIMGWRLMGCWDLSNPQCYLDHEVNMRHSLIYIYLVNFKFIYLH